MNDSMKRVKNQKLPRRDLWDIDNIIEGRNE